MFGHVRSITDRSYMLSSIMNICGPQFGPLLKKGDVGKICLTNSKAASIVCSRSSDVSIKAKGTPEAVVLVEMIKTNMLNQSSEEVESQKTISLAC